MTRQETHKLWDHSSKIIGRELHQWQPSQTWVTSQSAFLPFGNTTRGKSRKIIMALLRVASQGSDSSQAFPFWVNSLFLHFLWIRSLRKVHILWSTMWILKWNIRYYKILLWVELLVDSNTVVFVSWLITNNHQY